MSSATSSTGRHRKAKPMSLALRRAFIVAAVPVTGALLSAPSALAADKTAKTTATTQSVAAADGLDPAEQRIADNLNTRAQSPSLGDTFSGVVLDSASDKVVWGHNADTALMPASNAKLATATAALTVLGPEHRFTTKVVYGDGTLTLIGGGDRLLTTADLTELAKTAAAGVKLGGLDSVKVRVDDSLFAEPTLATGWNDSYYDDQVSPVRSLVVDGKLSADTSIDAGKVFAQQLADQGVTVDGEVTRGTAPATDVPVGHHLSPTLSETVKKMLKKSDNDIAETVLRMTALGAGRPATFEDGTAVVRDVLSGHYGVSMDNFQIHDGSGLSRADRIPAQTVADILDLVTDPRYRGLLRSIDEGLPVAGEAGSTLGPEWGRFDTADSQCAVGQVKAKTGTLTDAIALSGLTKAQDGRWKVFSFIENESSADPAATKDTLDGLAATVNGCWA
ncbi:D-alanyl-D-alanine carboxypeptidase/D-alanyl-D-alanine-endopeptidase [Streptomyces malaysiensis subsp. malaysiensis]|uniref:D-alanyl-D-alanine carboxypeptidase/D-alanyl-D-alanine-endopeptidase n=1 Tax=Streptomyces malaysiensis TaxID=92644 RepID=A0ABX6W331_STRMQ|nr:MULTISPECIES: D-alanyl-D-alanine carboxypeptidase/D-alanyl-D-alanine-endopeptidase [Streptomyces]QPI54876.1 D-alanyl-D-alanine carboxypeptidase/D-alanyl-D-alanine-endopeptidase [Streptomyces solisilvae]UHH16278.1 D-alanyl-D-alanine carboxypeptidase/D-alanyl-D-alanine-endopeptidase [Streptomyces sp. HNM0561]